MRMVPGENRLIDQMVREVTEYFAGSRKTFQLPLDLRGTQFERLVWSELLSIPYGETRTYGGIASVLGKPGAARAVGRANGANYLAIIVPCHRVIQEDGSLRGYGGGLWRKQHLLDLERNNTGQLSIQFLKRAGHSSDRLS
jgi:O-6-methylguanine DNA methyltransferase